MTDYNFNKYRTKSENKNLNINFILYFKLKEYSFINYNNIQFHIILYLLRDSNKKNKNYI